MTEQKEEKSAQIPRVPLKRSVFKRWGWYWIRAVSRFLFFVCCRFRAAGKENYPRDSGALVCSNHQSHFDPVIVGITCNRRMNFLARRTLYQSRILAPIMRFLDGIPLDREGTGLGGLKEMIRRLKRGELVVIFPEGTRTSDGEVSNFKPGFTTVARRCKSSIIPLGMDGAHKVWPRKRKLPWFGRIAVHIGEPIPFEEYEKLNDEELLELVETRVRNCHQKARELLAS